MSNSRQPLLLKTGAAAAFLAGILLLAGLLGRIAAFFKLGALGFLLPDNWLILIFKLHASAGSLSGDILRGRQLLDIIILVLMGVLCCSLSAAFTKAAKTWSLAAVFLTLAAIVLYLITQIAGRSTVMLAVLIISFAMRSNKLFNSSTIYSGILAGVLLFAGDLTVGINSSIITILFGVGYILLIAWLFLIAGRLFLLHSQ
jgi:hypothetical protein